MNVYGRMVEDITPELGEEFNLLAFLANSELYKKISPLYLPSITLQGDDGNIFKYNTDEETIEKVQKMKDSNSLRNYYIDFKSIVYPHEDDHMQSIDVRYLILNKENQIVNDSMTPNMMQVSPNMGHKLLRLSIPHIDPYDEIMLSIDYLIDIDKFNITLNQSPMQVLGDGSITYMSNMMPTGNITFVSTFSTDLPGLDNRLAGYPSTSYQLLYDFFK